MFSMLIPMVAKHGTAGAVGAATNMFLSGDEMDPMAMLKYAGVVAGSSFITCRLSSSANLEKKKSAFSTQFFILNFIFINNIGRLMT